MNIYVVEDEIIQLDDILITIKELAHSCVGHSGDPFEVIEQVDALKPDVVLMDIHLNGKKQGISLAKKIKKLSNTQIIYTSSDITTEVISEAADSDPITYLTKPVNKTDLMAALILTKKKIEKTNTIKETLPTEIFIKNRSKLIKIPIESILFAYTDTKNYCTIVTDDDKKFTVRNSIIGLQQLLAHERFIQTHRAYIINWRKVDVFYEGTQSIEIKGNTIPLGRSFKEHVYKRLKVI
ncbi:LytTR family DNA-binding domain-containing protein [uncultured Lacinutrix sp.]|uniref:LytR/AlgR family response regulator transcription factor n=1 Tax=uncultured Lacinutrix sp. TaxID=574032 RepID=UPI002605D817|nr:response regulator transcription factor [uncultured Lacinutrix sp.]